MSKCLVLQTPGSMTGSGGRKLENYIGIEFERNSSNGGGDNGYHKMIGDEELLSSLSIFNDNIYSALVKDAKVSAKLNEVNLNKTTDGANADLTGSDGSDVCKVFQNLWAIVGGTNVTYERFIYSDAYFEYDGDEAIRLSDWADSLDYEVIINNLARCVYGASVGSMGTTNATNISDGSYASGAGYPSTNLNRFQFEAAARARNNNTLSNLPYCNTTMLDQEAIIGMQYVECRTKNLTSVFGYGISSDVMPSDANWATTSGFRTKVDSAYKYLVFSSPVYIGGQSITIWQALNSQFPLLKVLEAQKGVSDGGTLKTVYDADGNAIQGKSQGQMTGIWEKTVTFTLNCAFSASEPAAAHTFELHLVQPLWRGTRNYGDIWWHRSGYDVLNYVDSAGTTHNMLYRAPSISAITTDSDSDDKTAAGQFAFESAYEQVADLGDTPGWMKDSINHNGRSLVVAKNPGAAINNYQSAWTELVKGTSGKYIRKTAGLSGGDAYDGYCVPRYVSVNDSPAAAWARLGSGFRVALS